MRPMNLFANDRESVPCNVSPRTPNRAYPYLRGLVLFLEKELPEVPHYYQGGFFLGMYTGEPRYTQDVDMTLVELSAYERVKEALSLYGEQLVASGQVSRYVVKPTTSELKSGGAKYYAPDGSILFSVDIGFHEQPLSTMALTYEGNSIQVTTIEQMLCDKMSALFSDRRLRRIKDLFDAWHILKTCTIDEDQFILRLAERGIYPLPSSMAPFTDEHLSRMESAYATISVYDRRDGSVYSKPDFWTIVETVGTFYCRFTDAEV